MSVPTNIQTQNPSRTVSLRNPSIDDPQSHEEVPSAKRHRSSPEKLSPFRDVTSSERPMIFIETEGTPSDIQILPTEEKKSNYHPEIPFEIFGYKLLKCIYKESSCVYRGLRSIDNCPVVIKINTQPLTEKKIWRFRKEFELGQQIKSPHVVRYLELKQGLPSGTIALIMEDDNAVELDSVIFAEGLPNDQFLKIAIQMVQGLQGIHAANIVHNDFKLSNILIQMETGTVKVIDFNRASTLRQEMRRYFSIRREIGTLAYLSPEQTGRVNRSVDYRTDFYSLGICFYRMLCGQLPFMAGDALGLIHQHLAKQPQPLHQRKPTIAIALSQLVSKLLEKEAENRYQSCEGILSDLQYCLDAWNRTGTIPEFKLGKEDISSKLLLSQHLYGRKNEIHTLLEIFERVSSGSREVLMVAGSPGVGKSMLIHEIQKSITLKNGYFLCGKFDQLHKSVSYSALSQAFEGLIKQLLTENETCLREWKNRLLKTLGNQGQLIVQIVPILESLIGPQPPPQIADPHQAKMVLNLVFLEFTKLFADASHPLVLFLDDLQWADNASLELMTFLLTRPGVHHMLWIGAYRNTEVTASHLAIQTLAQLKEAHISISTLILTPLSLDSLQEWITDSLHIPVAAMKPLIELIHQKTAGNPFFVKLFLETLYDQQLLNFSLKTRWQCELPRISQNSPAENVITLMTRQIRQLPPDTQKALTVASCLGHRLSLTTLQIGLANSSEIVHETLLPALNRGILIQTDGEILFAHDRIQEAAYGLVTEKARMHLILGQRLLDDPAGDEALLFYTVAQFSRCIQLIDQPGDRLRIARLNLKAAQRAKQATTYAISLEYLYRGQDLIDLGTLWKTDYPLTFTWYKELIEVEYLSGHFEISETLIKDIQPHLESTLDKVDMFYILILQKTLQGRYQDAITIANQTLQLLGSGFPLDNLQEFIEREAVNLKQKLQNRSITSLLNMSLVVEPKKQAILKILSSIHSACYLLGTELFPASVMMAVNLSLTYEQHVVESCHSYAVYGLLLCSSRFEEFALAYQFGHLATQLAEKLQAPAQYCKSSMVMLGFVYSWSKSIQHLPALFADTYESGLACGELEYAGYSAVHRVTTLFYRSTPLAKVQQEALPLLQFVQNTKNQLSTHAIEAVQRLLANLKGDTLDEQSFGITDEAKFEERCQQANSFYALCLYQILKAQAFYLYGHFEQGFVNLTSAKKNLTSISSHYATAIFNWYDSLTRLALFPTLSSEDQKAHLEQVSQNQRQMEKWQTCSPENFAHKYCLVEAELARIKENYEEAEKLYEEAIFLARRDGFIQEHALSAELATRYWISRNRPTGAQGYFNTAFNSYQQWGAKRKLLLLKVQYPNLLEALSPSGLSQLMINQKVALSGNTLKFLDLSSILKASQTISSEIELPKLLRGMIQLIIENAGAQKGAVLFVEADEILYVQAEYALDGTITTLQRTPLAEWTRGARSVIQDVKTLHHTVTIDNAITDERFKDDPYIISTQAKSILCIPILQHKALLYAENNLLSHAFIPERVQTLQILTSQIAISLENARYFAEQIALTKQLTQQSTRAEIAEASLHAVSHDLRLALQASKAGTWNFSIATGTITWDAASYALFGSTSEELKGTYRAFLERVHPEDVEMVKQSAKRCIEGDTPQDIEYRILWPDGSQHVIASRGQVYRDVAGRPIKMAGICIDVTKRKQLEQERLDALKKVEEERIRQQEALSYRKRQEEYTQTVCHELRNPLHGLIGTTELLKMEIGVSDSTYRPRTSTAGLKTGTQIENCREYVTNMEECADHLCVLLDDVLNLAKLEENKMELFVRSFQPKTIVQSVRKMFAAKAAEKKLQLHLELPEGDISIRGDAQRLKQVLINLLANALKFTEKGSITLGFTVLQTAATSIRLRFTVTDTGIGMTPTEQANLFQRFSQGSSDTSSKYGGTGLGLAISEKLVGLMGGRILVESKKGEGSQFYFVLECEPSSPKSIKTMGTQSDFDLKDVSSSSASTRKILIVDDNPINQKLLVRLLESLGYLTSIANNGKEAVQCFTEAGPFTLIFMDMEMPVMGGDQAAMLIRKKEQELHLASTPIICTTGHTEEQYRQQILAAGMNDMVTKPFKMGHIQQVLKTWIPSTTT